MCVCVCVCVRARACVRVCVCVPTPLSTSLCVTICPTCAIWLRCLQARHDANGATAVFHIKAGDIAPPQLDGIGLKRCAPLRPSREQQDGREQQVGKEVSMVGCVFAFLSLLFHFISFSAALSACPGFVSLCDISSRNRPFVAAGANNSAGAQIRNREVERSASKCVANGCVEPRIVLQAGVPHIGAKIVM